MSLSTQIPDTGTPIFDQGGYINPVWHQFFNTMLRRTGGTAGIDADAESAMLSATIEVGDSSSSNEDQAQLVPSFSIPEDPPGQVSNHGQQNDPALHDVATQTANGFMSSVDKAKLDGISIPAVSPAALTADVVTQNTTADGAVLTFTLPAGSVSVGTTIAARLSGLISSAASSGSFSVWIKIGAGKAIIQTFTIPAVAQSNVGLFYTSTITLRTAGGIGAVQISSLMTSNNNALNGGPAVNTNGASFNTTISNTLTIGWNWSVANASNVATAKNASFLLEKQ